jgi:hypothetical protein
MRFRSKSTPQKVADYVKHAPKRMSHMGKAPMMAGVGAVAAGGALAARKLRQGGESEDE